LKRGGRCSLQFNNGPIIISTAYNKLVKYGEKVYWQSWKVKKL